MNVSTFAGRIGGDPRIASVNGSQGATSVLNFSLAVDKRKTDPTTGKPLTLWVDCALWGKRADALAPYIKKGGYVTVTGEADVEMFQGQNGAGVKMTLNVNDLKLQGSAVAAPAGQQNQRPAAPAQNTYGQNAAPAQRAPMEPNIDFNDEIPF